MKNIFPRDTLDGTTTGSTTTIRTCFVGSGVRLFPMLRYSSHYVTRRTTRTEVCCCCRMLLRIPFFALHDERGNDCVVVCKRYPDKWVSRSLFGRHGEPRVCVIRIHKFGMTGGSYIDGVYVDAWVVE